MKNNPVLTIGLPVFNGENYLAETIESLLNQTFSDYELLIADNASTDSTLDIIERYAREDPRIRLMKSDDNRGAAWNFNRVFHECRSEYFKWAAHDDLYAPEFLARCINELDADDNAVLAFAGTEFIDSGGAYSRRYAFPMDVNEASKRDLFRFYACGGHIVHEIFGVIRRSALDGTPLIGGYVGSDLILLGRLALAGRFIQVPEVLFYHREHPGRSTVATRDNHGFTNWYDASKSGKYIAPRWRRIWESLKSPFCYRMSLGERMGHIYDVARAAFWSRSQLAYEAMYFVKQLFRSRPERVS